MDYPSKLVEEAVEQFSKLPGLGKKTALRFVLNILKMNKQEVSNFGNAFINLRNNINYCSNCHSISDLEICDICNNINRDDSIICVVEDIRDVMAIEKTNQFKGKYHVLGGVISPIDDIGL